MTLMTLKEFLDDLIVQVKSSTAKEHVQDVTVNLLVLTHDRKEIEVNDRTGNNEVSNIEFTIRHTAFTD